MLQKKLMLPWEQHIIKCNNRIFNHQTKWQCQLLMLSDILWHKQRCNYLITVMAIPHRQKEMKPYWVKFHHTSQEVQVWKKICCNNHQIFHRRIWYTIIQRCSLTLLLINLTHSMFRNMNNTNMVMTQEMNSHSVQMKCHMGKGTNTEATWSNECRLRTKKAMALRSRLSRKNGRIWDRSSLRISLRIARNPLTRHSNSGKANTTSTSLAKSELMAEFRALARKSTTSYTKDSLKTISITDMVGISIPTAISISAIGWTESGLDGVNWSTDQARFTRACGSIVSLWAHDTLHQKLSA